MKKYGFSQPNRQNQKLTKSASTFFCSRGTQATENSIFLLKLRQKYTFRMCNKFNPVTKFYDIQYIIFRLYYIFPKFE